MIEGKSGAAGDAVGTIQYKTPEGVEGTWQVGCAASDTEETLKAHLLHWHPNYEFLGATVTAVDSKLRGGTGVVTK